jgi:alpha-tubulin suppressor-like RCC1 family protein
LGNPDVERELLPKPVEALRGVRVGSVAAADNRTYAVSDKGELWAWGGHLCGTPALGDCGLIFSSLPKPIESSGGMKVDALAVGLNHALALAGDGRVHVWGGRDAPNSGLLGLGVSVRSAGRWRAVRAWIH